jgi:murein DD-endopeptidase MepM/ murein hydrolase activator NlpD
MSKKFNFGRKIAGKGYYIALILCAVAIGISGYLYYRAVNQPEDPQLGGSDIVAPGGDVQAGITLPGDNTNPTGPVKQPRPIGRPVSGEISKDYAMDCLSYNETTRDWRVHDGIDFAAEAGTQVSAVAAGTVSKVFKDDSLGYTVVITHEGGYATQYASLAEDVSVKVGDTVVMGEKIGTVANTALLETAQGDHLHFSVTLNNNPIDPEKFLETE